MLVDLEVLIAGGILAAAGWLQWSVSSGEQGINAFLMKEKQDNPFYNGKYKPEGTTAEPGRGGPSWLRRLRLPSLPYVEVYGEAAGQAGGRRQDTQHVHTPFQHTRAHTLPFNTHTH